MKNIDTLIAHIAEFEGELPDIIIKYIDEGSGENNRWTASFQLANGYGASGDGRSVAEAMEQLDAQCAELLREGKV